MHLGKYVSINLNQRVAKGLCVTRDKGSNLYVTRESYLKRNVIREYLNACDA